MLCRDISTTFVCEGWFDHWFRIRRSRDAAVFGMMPATALACVFGNETLSYNERYGFDSPCEELT